MPSVAPARTAPATDTRPETRLAPLYKVLLHNDPVTTMDFVIHVLRKVFGMSRTAAIRIMLEAHDTGTSLVTVEPREQAEFHVDQCHSLARPRYPLTLTIEPESQE